MSLGTVSHHRALESDRHCGHGDFDQIREMRNAYNAAFVWRPRSRSGHQARRSSVGSAEPYEVRFFAISSAQIPCVS